jgi:hypothetical protein
METENSIDPQTEERKYIEIVEAEPNESTKLLDDEEETVNNKAPQTAVESNGTVRRHDEPTELSFEKCKRKFCIDIFWLWPSMPNCLFAFQM